jgi:hypothetical protein
MIREGASVLGYVYIASRVTFLCEQKVEWIGHKLPKR